MPNTPRSEVHYTTTVEIVEVTHRDSNPGYPENKSSRDTKEITRLVLRSDSLEGLKNKLLSHITLVDNS